MQTIQITNVSGSGVYDIYICDITNTYCFLLASSPSIPTVHFSLPITFPNPLPGPTTITFGEISSLIIKVVDVGTGCETFIPYYCPSPTPTQTLTPTITPTIASCYCTTIENPFIIPLNFQFFDCSGVLSFETINSLEIIDRCGTSFTGDDGLIISVGSACISGLCPPPPSPTQTSSQTPTPTFTPTQTETPSPTPTFTPTQTETPSPTPTFTPTQTETPTMTPTPSIEPIGKLFQIGDTFIYMSGDIYIFQSQ